MTLPAAFVEQLERAVGAEHVKRDVDSLHAYGADALKRGHPADLVVLPGSTAEVAAIIRACAEHRVPVVPRGGGTGYTGGAVPLFGGVVLSLERMNRILQIDEANLIAVVEPNVVTGDLQDAVERVGLFYPPDPASLRQSVIGGNVAECAGGPRAFKYGTTKHYVLGLEAVLPTGEIVRTGGKSVKNVVGYDLTHLLVGSEGTLAVITQIILRLISRPPVHTTLRASFATIDAAVSAVVEITRARVVPSALEIVDRDSLDAVAAYLAVRSLAPEGTGAILLIDLDGTAAAVSEEARRAADACRTAGATEVLRARSEAERAELWRVRRELSLSLRRIAPLKLNHDVVVPKGRIPDLFAVVTRLKRDFDLRIPCFGHAGDGNIHVNIMVDPSDQAALERAHAAEHVLFEQVVALEGSISGEHGIGFAKAPYLGIELGADEIALMKRIKRAFDPLGILNPGKIFPA
jgi:glycolate dehydrogenase FAD-linked subunit